MNEKLRIIEVWRSKTDFRATHDECKMLIDAIGKRLYATCIRYKNNKDNALSVHGHSDALVAYVRVQDAEGQAMLREISDIRKNIAEVEEHMQHAITCMFDGNRDHVVRIAKAEFVGEMHILETLREKSTEIDRNVMHVIRRMANPFDYSRLRPRRS